MGIDAKMFVRTMHEPTDIELREWHYRFGCAFHEHLWAFGTYENKVPEKLYLFKVDEYEQDGPTIYPKPGEIFLELNPTSRYYGPGYERGNFPVLKAMAEFLEILIPESEVWYGGDSSGVCALRFGSMERRKMLIHYVNHQHTPYLDHKMRHKSTRPDCPYCHQECPQFGFGGDFASYTCLGCGWKEIIRGNVVHRGWVIDIDDFGSPKK